MRIPRDNLVRAIFPGVELRDATTGGLRTMTGHFAVFDQWTEINSVFEGRFLERIRPGAFQKTFSEGRAGMRSLFQHGQDPHIGNKPLGPIQRLEEDATGAYYEVGLLDTSYNRDLLPGLEAGLYGASFRFSVQRHDINKKAKESAMNPDGIPERTIREAQVMEFGPVTFPAYQGATAGVRSMTDAFTLKAFTDDPEALRMLLDYNEHTEPDRRGTTKLSTTAYVPVEYEKKVGIVVPDDIADEAVARAAELAAGEPDKIGAIRARLAELRDTTLPAESVDALGSLIEVCESSLEAMEYLLGIEDDAEDMAELQADMAMDAGETNSAPDVGDVRADTLESETSTAPPDGAEAEPHPIRGRRDSQKSYLSRKEQPSWRLPSKSA